MPECYDLKLLDNDITKESIGLKNITAFILVYPFFWI